MATIDDVLSVNLIPSLQHITAARICIDFYLQDHLLVFLKKRYHLFEIEKTTWAEEKSLVRKLISSLCLPESLKNVISNFTDNIGDELYCWMKSNEWLKHRPDYGVRPGTFPSAVYDYMKHYVVWASRGTIRYEKSARNILRSMYITDEERLQLACAYCFFDVLSHRFVPVLEKFRSLDAFSEKPMLCYWTCRIFPEKMLTFKIRLGLSNRENIDKYMLLNMNIPKNRIAKKYFFDRLNMNDKENAINGLLGDMDFKMKTWLLSQVSVATREEIFRNRPYILLKNTANILWQDYLLYYFNACQSFCSSLVYLKILREVHPYAINNTCTYFHSYEEDSYHEWKKSFIYDVWCSLSEDFSKDVIIQSLNNLNILHQNLLVRDGELPTYASLLPSYRSFSAKTILTQISYVALHFNDQRLIDRFLRMATEETVKLEVTDWLPNNRNLFSSDSVTFREMMYYPRRVISGRESANIEKRLHLMDKLLVARYSRCANLLKIERLQNDILDVYVEYCRFRAPEWIGEIMDFFIQTNPERAAYKSSILNEMINKLLYKAVNESFYYYDEQWTSAPAPAPRDVPMNPPAERVNVRIGRRNLINFPHLIPILAPRNPVRPVGVDVAPVENVHPNRRAPLRRNFADGVPVARRYPIVVGAPVENNRPAPRIVNPARRNEAQANAPNEPQPIIQDELLEGEPEPEEVHLDLQGIEIIRGIDGMYHQRRVGRVNDFGVVVHRGRRVYPAHNIPANLLFHAHAPVIRIPRLEDVPNVVVNPLHAVGANERRALRVPVIYNSDNCDVVFTAVDKYLNWHFHSAEQIDNFKTETIFNGRVPIIEELLIQNKTSKLKKVLRWFLSYDQEKINAFKNTSQRNELTSLL